MNRLEGRGAVITGGASGIGAHTARLLRTEGARVCVTDVDAAGADDGFLVLAPDVSREKDWLRARERVLAEFARVTTLVNNAGTFRPSMIADIPMADWERTPACRATAPPWPTRRRSGPSAA